MSEGEVQSITVKPTKENDMAKQEFVTKKDFDDFKNEMREMIKMLMKGKLDLNTNTPEQEVVQQVIKKEDEGTMNKK